MSPEQALVEVSAGRCLLIDVRDREEWATEHVPAAGVVPATALPDAISALVPDRSTRVVLYCGMGRRSADAAKGLTRIGYTRVSIIDGGIAAWRDRGLPLMAERKVGQTPHDGHPNPA
jgi:rhodanese-related sulfurtransferase